MIQSPCMRPWRMYFGGERNVKTNEMQKYRRSKRQQTISSSVFFRRTSRKKNIRTEGKKLYSVVQEQMRVSARQNDTFDNTNKLEAGPAAKGRDNEGQMRRAHDSSVLSRRATSAAPAQRKNCRYSSISSGWDHEKTKYRTYVFRRPPDRAGVLNSRKKRTKTTLFSFGRIRQLSTWCRFLVSSSTPA